MELMSDEEERTYLNTGPCYRAGRGKYQEIIDVLEKKIPERGSCDDVNLEVLRITINAYYDYYNNGGLNRDARLKPLLEKVKLPRGTEGSKVMSFLRRYNNGSIKYLPDGMPDKYDAIVNGVIETYFGEMIDA